MEKSIQQTLNQENETVAQIQERIELIAVASGKIALNDASLGPDPIKPSPANRLPKFS